MEAILKPSKIAGGTQYIECLHLDFQSGMSNEQYYFTPREPLEEGMVTPPGPWTTMVVS